MESNVWYQYHIYIFSNEFCILWNSTFLNLLSRTRLTVVGTLFISLLKSILSIQELSKIFAQKSAIDKFDKYTYYFKCNLNLPILPVVNKIRNHTSSYVIYTKTNQNTRYYISIFKLSYLKTTKIKQNQRRMKKKKEKPREISDMNRWVGESQLVESPRFFELEGMGTRAETGVRWKL